MGKTTKILSHLIFFTILFTLGFSKVVTGQVIIDNTSGANNQSHLSDLEIITINDLVEHSKEQDKSIITIQGEVIGEIMERGTYAWINIYDGTNTIGVWLPTDATKKINYFGDYKHKGDILRLQGTFYRNCFEHGGDVDIHLIDYDIIERGYPIIDYVSTLKKVTTLFLFIGTVLLSLIFYGRMKKKKE